LSSFTIYLWRQEYQCSWWYCGQTGQHNHGQLTWTRHWLILKIQRTAILYFNPPSLAIHTAYPITALPAYLRSSKLLAVVGGWSSSVHKATERENTFCFFDIPIISPDPDDSDASLAHKATTATSSITPSSSQSGPTSFLLTICPLW
jgi:hypothetical protein